MEATYIEHGCTFHGYEAGGAVVTPEHIVAYLGEQGCLQDWHGRVIGGYTVTSHWPIWNGCVSTTMFQCRAWVDGVRYTGRSAGVGMIFKGKRIRGQGAS